MGCASLANLPVEVSRQALDSPRARKVLSRLGSWRRAVLTVGIRVYALGAIALGTVGLLWGDFALVWQPVPEEMPGRTPLAYLFAAALLCAGVATNWRRTAAAGAVSLGALFALVVVLLHAPRVLTHPLVVAAWSGVAEQLALVCGALVACALLEVPGGERAQAYLRLAHWGFGGCLIVFGLVHFFYLSETAAMVPTGCRRGRGSGPWPPVSRTSRPESRS